MNNKTQELPWINGWQFLPGHEHGPVYLFKIEKRVGLIEEFRCGGVYKNGRPHKCIATIRCYITGNVQGEDDSSILTTLDKVTSGNTTINCLDDYEFCLDRIKEKNEERMVIMSDQYSCAPPNEVAEIVIDKNITIFDVREWINIDDGSFNFGKD